MAAATAAAGTYHPCFRAPQGHCSREPLHRTPPGCLSAALQPGPASEAPCARRWCFCRLPWWRTRRSRRITGWMSRRSWRPRTRTSSPRRCRLSQHRRVLAAPAHDWTQLVGVRHTCSSVVAVAKSQSCHLLAVTVPLHASQAHTLPASVTVDHWALWWRAATAHAAPLSGLTRNAIPASNIVMVPQVEVLFAALWSVSAWRGVYSMLRPYI